MNRLLFVIAAFCSMWVTHAAGFDRPKTGITVDQSFEVSLSVELPRECIAWHIKGVELNVIVALDKKLLEQRALAESRLRTDIEKLFLAANKPPGQSGCVELEYAQLGNSILLFDGAVENGSAVILDGTTNVAATYVVVRYFSTEGFGGNVTYQIQGQRPFRARRWWIS